MDPEADALADGGGLGGLQVGEAEADDAAGLQCLGGEGLDHHRQPGSDQIEAVAHHHQIGVVGDKGTRGPEVEDRPGLGAGIAIGVQVGENVVPHLLLVGGRLHEIDRLQMGAELGDLLRRDRQAQLRLRLRQSQPGLTPQPVAMAIAPEAGHFRRGIPGCQRVFPHIAGAN